MYLLGLGLVLMVLKLLEIGQVATWDWWQVLMPFALAVLWWGWADWSGYTKRKAVERTNKKQQDRLDKARDALNPNRHKRR